MPLDMEGSPPLRRCSSCFNSAIVSSRGLGLAVCVMTKADHEGGMDWSICTEASWSDTVVPASSTASLRFIKVFMKCSRGTPPPQNPNEKRKLGTCFYCKLPGHHIRDCRKRLADMKNQSSSSATHGARLFVVCLNITLDSYTWFIDSGATQHMTGHREWFVSFHPNIVESYVYLGDDSR